MYQCMLSWNYKKYLILVRFWFCNFWFKNRIESFGSLRCLPIQFSNFKKFESKLNKSNPTECFLAHNIFRSVMAPKNRGGQGLSLSVSIAYPITSQVQIQTLPSWVSQLNHRHSYPSKPPPSYLFSTFSANYSPPSPNANSPRIEKIELLSSVSNLLPLKFFFFFKKRLTHQKVTMQEYIRLNNVLTKRKPNRKKNQK